MNYIYFTRVNEMRNAKFILFFLIFSVLVVPTTAVSDNFSITPSLWEDRLVETSFNTIMNIENKEDSTRTFKIEPASFLDTQTCGLDYDTEFPPAIAVDENQFSLEPGETKEIAITGSYDPSRTDGFFGALLMSDITEQLAGTEGISNKARIAATFRMRGQEPWTVDVVPEVAEVYQEGLNAVQYTLRLRNTGKLDIVATGTVEAELNGVMVREQLTEQRIYPGLCGYVSAIFDYDSLNQDTIEFIANPIIQSEKTGSNDQKIFDVEGLNISKIVEIENNGLADKRFQLNIFNALQVSEDGSEKVLVQYRLENVGKLTGNPIVNISIGEPGSSPELGGKSYQAIQPGEFAEGEISFDVEEGVYDIEISLYEGDSTYDVQSKRLTILGEANTFDVRYLVLILPLLVLIYLVTEQRRKIKELEKK
jgi:hypothetical protein